MTPEQIKRAKRLAEILGITVYDNCDGPTQDDCFLDFYDPRGDMGPKIFNPEQDKALLWDLLSKYEVNICKVHNEAYVIDENAGEFDSGTLCVKRFEGDSMPAALIDCVIEINGGYNEQS